MAKKDDKTNVMRLLEQKKISYEAVSLDNADGLTGEEIAKALNEDPGQAFKTLVTTGKSGTHYVFVIPVASELNLKLAASAVSEKSIEMLKQKDLLPLTGYVHGGCSPIGMKKFFTTTIDSSALNYDEIYFSAGKIGHQVKVAISDIDKIIRVSYADVINH
ncbi:MAG: Cys-tRNA(Pro) deacylase [Lachnospiraceae bacterium]|nr:Cys-tRNA(Pro) deacylase [Lachnospiraceae bacterium]